MKRRRFLQISGGTIAGAAATHWIGKLPLYASSPLHKLTRKALELDTTLVVIQLFGGNDGLNTIIPAEDPRYYQLRPNLAVPKEEAVRFGSSDVFLHPALVNGVYKNGLYRLIDNGWLAVVQGIGYDHPNLSHFRSTDIWLSGINSSDPNVRLNSGWLGRFFTHIYPDFPLLLPEHPLCIQVGGTPSLLFRSPKGDVAITLTDPEKFLESGNLSPDAEPLDEDSLFAQEYNYVLSVAQEANQYAEVIQQAFDNGRNVVEYDGGFPQQLRLVARLISGGLKTKVYLVYLSSFDTHVQQQDEPGSGAHPALLRALSTGISQFMDDLVQQGIADNVIGMTISEFGRRPYENNSRGTDHGAASVQLVFGTSVRGGVYGNNPDLENLNENGDLVYQYDYRRVYAEILQTWFGGTPEDVEAVLQQRILPLSILNPPTSLQLDTAAAFVQHFRVLPQPSNGPFTVELHLRHPATVDIAIYSLLGRYVTTITHAALPAGIHRFQGFLQHSGEYICVCRLNNRRNLTKTLIIQR